MKKLITAAMFLALTHFLFVPKGFSQDTNSPENYYNLAQSHEKVKSYKLAAENYMQAGKGYEAKAKEYTTDALINKNLQTAVDAYSKAAAMYKNAKDISNENEARREAMRTSAPLVKKKMEAYRDSVKKNPPKDNKADIKQIPWKPGKEISLNARKAIFVITLPEALKYNGPRVYTRETNQMLRESETFISVIGINAFPRLQFSLKEYIGDAGSRSIQDYCEGEGAGKAPKVIPFLGLTETRLVSIGAETKACLKTNESRQVDTKEYMLGFNMIFYYKNNSYHLSGSGPYEWKTSILEMLKTFRIAGEEIPPKSCQESEEYLLENLAFEKVYKLPDENKDVKISIEPYLARNKVSDSWHLITQTIIDVLSAYQDLGDKFDLLVNGKKMLYAKPGEFKNWVKMEITIRSLNLPDISPANVIQGYIDVFDKTIKAISGLESKISNMTVNLSWEVPYQNITTQCIPRFICVNGKMEPDKKNLTYRKVSKGTQTDRQAYQNVTPNQAMDKKEKVLNRFLNEIKKDAEAYANASSCSDFTGRLYNVKFPVTPDECARKQTAVTRLEAEQRSIYAQKIDLIKRLNSHNATRQARVDERTNKIQQNEKSVVQKRETLRQKEGLKKNYESSTVANKEALIKDIDDQITALNIQVGNMITETLQLEWERNDLVANKFEKDIKLELDVMEARAKKLAKELATAQDELSKCR